MAALLVIVSSQGASAQRPRKFQPARATFSPYLLYSQFNGTGIPNYYSYVRPARDARDFVQRVQSVSQRQPLTTDIEQAVDSALDEKLRQRQTTGSGQPFMPALFNDRSHFYPSPVQTRAR